MTLLIKALFPWANVSKPNESSFSTVLCLEAKDDGARQKTTEDHSTPLWLQDIIDDYDDQGIQMSRPFRKKRSKKEKPEAFRREAADASASESADYDSSVDIEAVKQDLKSRAGNAGMLLKRPGHPAGLAED